MFAVPAAADKTQAHPEIAQKQPRERSILDSRFGGDFINLSSTLRDFISRYGSPFTTEGAEFRGVFSPQNRASPNYLHTGAGELGADVDGKLLLLAPPDAPLKKGGRIGCQGREYAILAADDYLLAGEPLYRRAVLEQFARGGSAAPVKRKDASP